MYAAIHHHKAVFQAAVLDMKTGAAVNERFEGSRASLVALRSGRDDGHAGVGVPHRSRRRVRSPTSPAVAINGPSGGLQGQRTGPHFGFDAGALVVEDMGVRSSFDMVVIGTGE